MLKNNKNVFWEALLITICIFVAGLFLGIYIESTRFNEINNYYDNSEISFIDGLVLNDLVGLSNTNCEELLSSNVKFADRIYNEAKLLEKYEDSGRLTETLKVAHKKYDLLRTFLWINNIKIKETCESNSSYIIYLYEYNSDNLETKALQNVWSKILTELKEEMGNQVVLIPIAANQDIVSLNLMLSQFNISKFPVVIIDNKYILEDVDSVDNLREYIQN
jgi:hypothetical protein